MGKMKEEDYCLNLKPNDENTACAKCKVKIGVIPISSNGLVQSEEFWICEDCDNDMGWGKD